MRCAIYARCSLADMNVGAQLAECRTEAARRGWEVVEFVDQGVSGGTMQRPAFDSMMAAVRVKEVQAVMAVAGDRIGRSLSGTLTVHDELQKLGCALVLLRGGADTTTPAGLLTFHLMQAVAEFERGNLRLRTKAALAHLKAQGVKLGRPRSRTPQDADILALRALGISGREIARRLGASQATVSRTLRAAA